MSKWLHFLINIGIHIFAYALIDNKTYGIVVYLKAKQKARNIISG